MPWFKVDDNLGFHHKVIAAGNPAMGLWVRAGSVCAQQLTDGFVPDHLATVLGTKAQADKLVAVGLWDRVEGGYTFHEWEERQPSKADVEAERAAAADRMRAHRERKRKATQQASSQVSGSRSPEQTAKFGVGSEEVRDVFGDPDPTRPDPTTSSFRTSDGARSPKKAPTRRLPANWQPTDEHKKRAAESGVDLDQQAAKFRLHAEENDRKAANWNAAFTRWLMNAAEWAPRTKPAAPVRPHVSLLEPAPSGMTDEEYDAWEAAQLEKRRRA